MEKVVKAKHACSKRQAHGSASSSVDVEVICTLIAPMALAHFVFRWIIFFQMLLEMRLIAHHKKQQKKLQHNTSVVSNYGASPLRTPAIQKRQPPGGLKEEGSMTSHASKYLLTCDDIFKISRKAHDGESGEHC